MTDPIRWKSTPPQARGRATRERFVQAAFRMMQERAYEEIPLTQLVKEAKSSIGSFYHYFGDKDGLLHEAHTRFCDEGAATLEATLQGELLEQPLPDIVAAFCQFMVGLARENRGVRRAFLLARVQDEQFRERSKELDNKIIDGFTQVVKSKRPKMNNPEVVTAFAFEILDSVVDNIILVETDRLLDDELATQLGRALNAYFDAHP